jgi:hypothetical protein
MRTVEKLLRRSEHEDHHGQLHPDTLDNPDGPEAAGLIEELVAVCEMIVKASMGETRPSRGESFIGWQRGDGANADSVRAAARAALSKAHHTGG